MVEKSSPTVKVGLLFLVGGEVDVQSPSGLAGSATSPLCEEAFTRAKPAQKGAPRSGELAAKQA